MKPRVFVIDADVVPYLQFAQVLLETGEYGWTANLPYGHLLADSLKTANVTFVWLGQRLTMLGGVHLGMALADPEMPLYAGASDERVFSGEGKLVADRAYKKVVSAAGPRDAYEHLLADIDVRPPDVYSRMTVNMHGTCAACGSGYYFGAQVYKHKFLEDVALHADCYLRRRNPGALDAAVFHADLVGALRKENADLERRLEKYEPRPFFKEQIEVARLSDQVVTSLQRAHARAG